MNGAEVPDALVKAAVQRVYDDEGLWIKADVVRVALAAVLPEVQASALDWLATLLQGRNTPADGTHIGPIGLRDLAHDLRAGTLTARLRAAETERTS